MKRAILSILCVLTLVGCSSRRSKIVSRSDMVKIYADMIMTDQWLNAHREYYHTADTSFVYEPIFERYGYDADSWRASVEYYLKDPERYSKILRRTTELLQQRDKELKRQKSIAEALEQYAQKEDLYKPEKVYVLSGLYSHDRFGENVYVDTVGGDWRFDPSKGADTVYNGPMLVFPKQELDTLSAHGSVSVALDSLCVAADSIAMPLDSLPSAKGTIAIEKSDNHITPLPLANREVL